MKLTDFIQDAGRPVAFYPSLRRITGSTTATLFLCQLIYWKGKEADADGWIYKTSEEMEAETGLSYNEQKTARANLKDAGLIEEHYARLDHKLKFRLNFDTINEKWGNADTDNGESGNPSFGNDTSPNSLNESENTTENTSNPSQIKGIEAAIWQGRPVTEDDIDPYKSEREALVAFETALHLPGNWEWYPAKTTQAKEWAQLREFVKKQYSQDPGQFEKYHRWRNEKYARGAMSNRAIKAAPADFQASWSDFLASFAMYGNSEEKTRLL